MTTAYIAICNSERQADYYLWIAQQGSTTVHALTKRKFTVKISRKVAYDILRSLEDLGLVERDGKDAVTGEIIWRALPPWRQVDFDEVAA